ncbi:alpha-tectorin-like [Bufo bufo]|uniref:alpha-tectorin-like n=1 Tax=Bufo bufo TaxID=8384 RepID=UPI001ABE9454|nr:alpha-tectorin-like [Bufo bufo]
MKILLSLLLALCTVLSVHAVDEQLCEGSGNCTCDLTKYNETVKPPCLTVQCTNGEMVIYIPKCQLEKNRFNTTSLSLSNYTGPECGSRNYLVNKEFQVGFHNPLNMAKCGNNVTVNSTHVVYTNVLHIYGNQSPKLITKNNASVSLSCIFPLKYNVQLNIPLKPKLSQTEITVPGVDGQLTVTMAVFTDPGFTIMADDTTTLYVEILRLYATPGGSAPENGLVFNLTSGSDGCPDPQYGELISILNNGNGSEARFTMKVFKITNQELVQLYADVTICTSKCLSSCTQRIGKSNTPANMKTLTVELNAISNPISGATDRFSLSWTLISLISSLLFVKFM